MKQSDKAQKSGPTYYGSRRGVGFTYDPAHPPSTIELALSSNDLIIPVKVDSLSTPKLKGKGFEAAVKNAKKAMTALAEGHAFTVRVPVRVLAECLATGFFKKPCPHYEHETMGQRLAPATWRVLVDAVKARKQNLSMDEIMVLGGKAEAPAKKEPFKPVLIRGGGKHAAPALGLGATAAGSAR